MSLRIALLAFILLIACGEDIVPTTNPAASAGEKTVAAALLAQDVIRDQLDTLVEKTAPGLPPVFLPKVKLATGDAVRALTAKVQGGETKAEFHGPVIGPDGLEAWYAQHFTITTTEQTAWGPKTIDTHVRLLLKASPSWDFSRGWPKTLVKLDLALEGMSGLFEGYRLLQGISLVDSENYEGTWQQRVDKPQGELSYGKFLHGTLLSGAYRLHKDDGFDGGLSLRSASVTFDKTYANAFTQTIHIIERWPGKGTLVDASPSEDINEHRLFMRFQRTDTLQQTASLSRGTYTLRGPAEYKIVGYWGRGVTDPEVAEEPAFADDQSPRGEAFVDVTDATSPGLLTWFELGFIAGSDFEYRESAGEGKATGTCSLQASLLRHDQSRCSVKLDVCSAFSKRVFWELPEDNCK